MGKGSITLTERKILVFNKVKNEGKTYDEAYEEVSQLIRETSKNLVKTKISEVVAEGDKIKGFKDNFAELKKRRR